ncbi:MAG: 1-(5-phosphoribosyl)-5-[(5-phosphoribosylamino)methylideneamino]imidazole-4-carboxamide isomerase [bacterium]|nr:1-(5-phosphoribosyl)-5-[(5-phosphoribosylamino)methylideneamino]imidazole-4-carboxamide isomerase [bacterium]
MQLYPAIDIKSGKAVRLTRGKFDSGKIYFDNPLDAAKKWVDEGATWLHLVDLDGARSGKPENVKQIEEIIHTVHIPVQIGGGIRSQEVAEIYLALGAGRVIVGTAILENPGMIRQVAKKYPKRIAVGLDAKMGKLAIQGWLKTSDEDVISLGKQCRKWGASHIIFTDIERDGMLAGPNFQATKQMIHKSGLPVIASGGISSLVDLRRLKEIGASGAILGKSLYEGSIKLREALTIC